jgi:hypothetical protein
MKCKLVVAGVALMVTGACVPPPVSLSHNFVVSYIAPDARDSSVWTDAHGTVTNTGATPADYVVELVASSGENRSVTVEDVLVGQTALWWTKFPPGVTIFQAGTTASPTVAAPVPAVAAITSQEPAAWVMSYIPNGTWVRGTVTNTGMLAACFVIELQASSGEVGMAFYYGTVRPGETVPWQTGFHGRVVARILRTTYHCPSDIPPPP